MNDTTKNSLIHRALTIGFILILGILLSILQFEDPRINDNYQRYSATIVGLINQQVELAYDEDSHVTVFGRMETDKIGDVVTIYRRYRFP